MTSRAPHLRRETCPLRILLADDARDCRLLLKSYFKDISCKIEMAENGEEALRKFGLGGYDIILMDVQMPVVDGLTAAKKIREMESAKGRRAIPIIALTANEGEEERQRCLSSGFTDLLTKPINRDLLLRKTLKHMEPALRGGAKRSKPASNGPVVRVDREIEDLVPGYLQNRCTDIETMRRALSEGNFELIRSLGHRMKGSGEGYGFKRITRIGASLEQAAIGQDRTLISRLADELSDFLDRVRVLYE